MSRSSHQFLFPASLASWSFLIFALLAIRSILAGEPGTLALLQMPASYQVPSTATIRVPFPGPRDSDQPLTGVSEHWKPIRTSRGMVRGLTWQRFALADKQKVHWRALSLALRHHDLALVSSPRTLIRGIEKTLRTFTGAVADELLEQLARPLDQRTLARTGELLRTAYPSSFQRLAVDQSVAHGNTVKELRCLALNIYFEARGEPKRGKRAVGHVVMNRVANPRFPRSICQVVQQGGEQRLHRCQFSWWCDGLSDRPQNRRAWRESLLLASQIWLGESEDPTGGALWYHADYARPVWRYALSRGPKIGQHVFYRPPASMVRES